MPGKRIRTGKKKIYSGQSPVPGGRIVLALLLCFITGGMIFMTGCSGEESDMGEQEATAAAEASGEVIVPEMVPVETETADIYPESEAASSDEDTSEEQTEEAQEDTTESVSEDETGKDEDIPADKEGIFTSEPVPDDVFQRMNGVSFPADCTISRDDLRYLRLSYYDFNGEPQVGELVCNKKIAGDLTEIFSELYKRGYQIEKMKLIDDYGGDDDLSCADNNTSCFNYRTVAGSTHLSKHALGLAIDINPFYNPYVTYPGGVERISPPGSEPYADRSSDFPHKIGPGDDVYELFIAHGFTWGGNWKTMKDYQHFQKG